MKSLKYIYSILFKACSVFLYHQSEILRQKLFAVTAKFILWIFTKTYEKNTFIPVAMMFSCGSKCKPHFISLQLNQKNFHKIGIWSTRSLHSVTRYHICIITIFILYRLRLYGRLYIVWKLKSDAVPNNEKRYYNITQDTQYLG